MCYVEYLGPAVLKIGEPVEATTDVNCVKHVVQKSTSSTRRQAGTRFAIRCENTLSTWLNTVGPTIGEVGESEVYVYAICQHLINIPNIPLPEERICVCVWVTTVLVTNNSVETSSIEFKLTIWYLMKWKNGMKIRQTFRNMAWMALLRNSTEFIW